MSLTMEQGTEPVATFTEAKKEDEIVEEPAVLEEPGQPEMPDPAPLASPWDSFRSSRRKNSADATEASEKYDDYAVFTKPAKELKLDSRLKELRKSVRMLEKAIDVAYADLQTDDGEPEATNDDPRVRKSIPSVEHMSLATFKQRYKDNGQDFLLYKKHHTIDAVMTAGWNPSPTSVMSSVSLDAESGKSGSKSVRFIQINSQALCNILHKYARPALAGKDAPKAPSIMFAPFKPLCFYEDKLRAHLEDLRTKYNGVSWEKLELSKSERKDTTMPIKPDERPDEKSDEKPDEMTGEGLDNDQNQQRNSVTVDADTVIAPADARTATLSSEPTEPNLTARPSVAHDEVEQGLDDWSSVNYLVSWGGLEANLRFSDAQHLCWVELPNQPVEAVYFVDLIKIEALERTVDTSPIVGLKINYHGGWQEEFMFINHETAQAELDHTCNVLLLLVERCRRSRSIPRKDPLKTSAFSKVFKEGQANTDCINSPAESTQKTIAEMETEELNKDIEADDRAVLFQKLVQKSNWIPVETSNDDIGDIGMLSRGEVSSGRSSFKAFEDLECLMKFFDEYIKPSWDPIKAKTIKTITFAELSLFFREGDHIHVPEDDHKVWRIAQVTGAKPTFDHLLSDNFKSNGESAADFGDVQKQSKQEEATAPARDTQGKRSNESDNWTSLYLDCYYLDFDGHLLGPVHRFFQLKFFPGRKEIKNLKAYPIEWLKQTMPTGSDLKLLQNIEQNGKRFEELCLAPKNARKLLFYYDGRSNPLSTSGKALELTRDDFFYGSTPKYARAEDVSSHVVIDFGKTFQYNPTWQPQFLVPTLTQKDVRETVSSNLNGKAYSHEDYRTVLETDCYAWEADFERGQTDSWLKEDIWTQRDVEDTTDKRNALYRNDRELLPDKVYGFVLRTRSWACLNIQEDQLTEVKEETAPWHELQIPDEHRLTLQSLVKRHFNAKVAALDAKRSNDFDIIEGKGRGLIVLLHGAPGTGKTSTAESIAAFYNKPLLPITCGNLGLTAQSVERALSENFELAQAWDCIVLLDEADVFLAQRENSDLARNALVSVFLRTLEYYSGILFLTTNRIGTFDEAFRSRIHSALFYRDLDRESTMKLWNSSLVRLQKQKEHLKQSFKILEPDTIVEYASKIWDIYKIFRRVPWNGREIRNAFQTAVALAEFKASDGDEPDSVPTLTWENFRSVIIASQDFERYLVDTRGGESDYDRAGRKQLRRDPSGLDQSEIGRKIQQQQQVEAFTQALKRVTPHDIITYPLPFQPVPGPGSLDRAMTINDLVSSNTPLSTSTFGANPVASYQQFGVPQFNGQNQAMQSQVNLQHQQSPQYAPMPSNSLPSMGHFMAGSNTFTNQAYAASNQVHGASISNFTQQQQQQLQPQYSQAHNPSPQHDPFQVPRMPSQQYTNLIPQTGLTVGQETFQNPQISFANTNPTMQTSFSTTTVPLSQSPGLVSNLGHNTYNDAGAPGTPSPAPM